MGHVTVLVADDHPFILEGVSTLLSRVPDFDVIAQHLDGCSALDGIRQKSPHIAVLDILMPKLDGIAILRSVEAERLMTRVVLLTGSLTDENIAAAVSHGAWGIVLKDTAAEDLCRCLKKVANGERSLPPELVQPALAREADRREEARSLNNVLTRRERDIARLVADGLSNRAIAQRIGVSEGTVKVHLYNIYPKLRVSNRISLATFVQQHLTRKS